MAGKVGRPRKPKAKKMYRRKNQRYNSRKYGIVKQMNYNGFHCYKEKVFQQVTLAPGIDGSCAFGGTPWAGDVKQFVFSDITDSANLVQLHDEYRITAIKLKVFPVWTSADADTSTTPLSQHVGNCPVLWYNYDFNDATNPSSFGSLMERAPKTVLFDKPISIFIKNPHVLALTSNDPSLPVDITNMVRRPKRSPWLGTTHPNVAHLGLQWGLFGAPPNGSLRVNTVMTYYFQCKGQL